MGKLIILIAIGICPLICYSQKSERDTVFLIQIYQDPEKYLVSQRVLEFDSIDKTELMSRFENWAGQNFRNYDKVRTSKTDNQITLNYITSSFITVLDFYLNMVVEFKDDKIRVQIFDDGNVYKAGYYSGSTYIPGTSARLYHVKSYFTDGMLIYKTKPGVLNVNERNATGSLNYKTSINSTIEEIYQFVLNENQTNKVKKDDDDWR